jgi:steroid delta-isomerase-like uncharacterized protein
MSEANKAVVRRIYVEAFGEGRMEALDEVIAADAVDHSPPPDATGDTRADLKDFATAMRQAIPDVRFRIVQEVAEGDTVVVHYEMSGTLQGEWLGVPASGAPISFQGVDIIRVRDRVCTEHWGWNDSWQLLLAAGGPPG